MTEPIQLVSFDLCPFVQRSVITLNEKGVAYDIKYIDLANKPEWFLKISPMGKVPLLQLGDTVLFESAVINEYLDETTSPRLHPEEPLERARHRMWVEFSSALNGDSYRLMVAGDEESAKKHAGSLKGKLERLDDELGDGPLFAGESFSLVDAAMGPTMQRVLWMHRLAPELGLVDGLSKIQAYAETLMARDSVINSISKTAEKDFHGMLAGASSWLGSRG